MKKLLIYTLIAFFITSCSPTIRSFSDYDKDVFVSNYKTYSWLDLKTIEQKGSNPIYYNELTDKRIKNAVDVQMLLKGLRLVKDNGELKLHYHIVVEDKTNISTDPIGYNYGPYWVGRKVNVFQYTEGTLIVDMMDAKSNALAWRGWATDVVTENNRKNPEKGIINAINSIFKKYPYHHQQ